MSSAPNQKRITPTRLGVETTVSRYEQVSSFLVAAVILFGFAVLILFLIWLTQVIKFGPREIKMETIEELLGNNNNPEGLEQDFEEPGVEELPDVQEPQLADALEAMTDAVSTQRAAIEAIDGNVEEMGSGRGVGDNRDPGPGSGNTKMVPEWERWEIRYSTSSPAEYGKQLDFFNIELGALSKDTPDIGYASSLGQSKPATRRGRRNEEKRVYFSYGDSILRKWDSQFLAAAGVATRGRLLVQFYPQATRSQLLSIEKDYLGNRSLQDVLKTIFGVRSTGSGFEYYVMDMKLR